MEREIFNLLLFNSGIPKDCFLRGSELSRIPNDFCYNYNVTMYTRETNKIQDVE